MRSLNDAKFVAWARSSSPPPVTWCVYCGHKLDGPQAYTEPPTCDQHDDLPALDPYYEA